MDEKYGLLGRDRQPLDARGKKVFNRSEMMNSPVSGEPEDIVGGIKSAIDTGAKSIVVKVETAAKTFYEKHLPLVYALGGAAVGALLMLIKLKL
jgi:hypothetical protein